MDTLSDELYEKLHQILETENGKLYSIEEVKEIGRDLIEFYDVLSESNVDDSA